MLTLICGMPRAGKTTYAKRFNNVIHLDGLGYHNVKTKVSPRTDDITVEGVYEHPRQRARLIEAYKGKGARCIWLDTPLEVRKTRPMGLLLCLLVHPLYTDHFPIRTTPGADGMFVSPMEQKWSTMS